jgi:hypothetical protein
LHIQNVQIEISNINIAPKRSLSKMSKTLTFQNFSLLRQNQVLNAEKNLRREIDEQMLPLKVKHDKMKQRHEELHDVHAELKEAARMRTEALWR